MLATLGGGCFWCIEAFFQRVQGVTEVTSGYSGGNLPNPMYAEVNTGVTGHVEAVQIDFDESKISYQEILDIFFQVHDPTQKDRQGPDVGEEYHSTILYHSEEQKEIANSTIAKLKSDGVKAATTVKKYVDFYPAEEEHQNFYNNNTRAPYCAIMISPKLKKFAHLLKKQ